MAIKGEKVLAVIPARGGSKRCPGKNIRPFRGKPLLVWSILAASKSKYIDLIAVSSEDEEIRDVARTYSPIDPKTLIINRPRELALDSSTNEDVLRHVLGIHPDFQWVILLQPTSPLRTSEDIDNCLELAFLNGTGCVSYRKSTGRKNGAVYVCRTGYLMENDFDKAFQTFYLMPDERSLDIDWAEEFALGN